MMKRFLTGVLSIIAGTALVLTYFAGACSEDAGSVNVPPAKETPPAAFQGPSGTLSEMETVPEPDPEPEQPASNIGSTLLPVLVVIGIGGCAGWYFKIYRPKKQRAADAAEDNYEFEYDDALPWEDEDDTERWDSV